MKIEILSETITNEDLFEQLNLQSPEIEFKLEAIPEDTRPISESIIIAFIGSFGIGGVITAFVNALIGVKLKKMDLEDKKLDRELKVKELELTKETELAKIQAEKENIVLQGCIEIIAKHHENLIKEGKVEEVLKLKNIGIVFDNENIRIPLSLNKEIINELGVIINEINVEKVAHYKE